MRKSSIWIVAIVVAGIAGFLARSTFRAAEHSRGTLRALAQRQQSLDAEIEQVRRSLASTRRSETELKIALADVKAPGAKTPASAAAQTTKPTPRPEFADLMQIDPALRKMFRQGYGTDLPGQWRLLYARGELSPAQIERFEAIMIEASEDRMDLQAAAKEHGLSADKLAEMHRQLADRVQAAQKEILGEVGFEEMKRVEHRRPIEPILRLVGRSLMPSGDSLTPQQSDKLMDIFAAASSDYPQGRTVDIHNIDTGAVLQQAQPFLTPVQFAALRDNMNFIEVHKLTQRFFQQQKAAGTN